VGFPHFLKSHLKLAALRPHLKLAALRPEHGKIRADFNDPGSTPPASGFMY
jgi:hypothetical protein